MQAVKSFLIGVVLLAAVTGLGAMVMMDLSRPMPQVSEGTYSPGQVIMTLEGGHSVVFSKQFSSSFEFEVYGPEGLDRKILVRLSGGMESLHFNGVGTCQAGLHSNGSLLVLPVLNY